MTANDLNTAVTSYDTENLLPVKCVYNGKRSSSVWVLPALSVYMEFSP